MFVDQVHLYFSERCMHVCTDLPCYVCVCKYLNIYIYIQVSTAMYTCAHVCGDMYIYIYICIKIVYVCIHIHIHIYIYVYLYIYIYNYTYRGAVRLLHPPGLDPQDEAKAKEEEAAAAEEWDLCLSPGLRALML